MNRSKRLLALLLSALTLCLAACGTAQDPAPTATTVPAASSDTESGPDSHEGELPIPQVPDPLTWEKLNALPVANKDMTVQELRQLCIDFFEISGTFQWTPTDTFTYNKSNGIPMTFSRGYLYGGLPYSNDSGSNVYAFMDFYDEKTGVIDTSGMKLSFGSLLGNDCSSAVAWAWARVSTTIDFEVTWFMLPLHGCIPLGDYQFDTSIKSFQNIGGTGTVTKANGEQKMFEAYALMEMADGIVMYGSAGGHTRMIAENHPVRNADGTLSDTESFVTVMEQISSTTVEDQNGVPVIVESGHFKKYTYAQLFKSTYLPVTIAEFHGDAIEEAQVKLTGVPENVDLDTLFEGTIETNYRIAKILISLTDADGNQVYSGVKYGTKKTMYSMPVSTAMTRAALNRNMKTGQSYTLTLSALLGNGQTVEFYSGPASR